MDRASLVGGFREATEFAGRDGVALVVVVKFNSLLYHSLIRSGRALCNTKMGGFEMNRSSSILPTHTVSTHTSVLFNNSSKAPCLLRSLPLFRISCVTLAINAIFLLAVPLATFESGAMNFSLTICR